MLNKMVLDGKRMTNRSRFHVYMENCVIKMQCVVELWLRAIHDTVKVPVHKLDLMNVEFFCFHSGLENSFCNQKTTPCYGLFLMGDLKLHLCLISLDFYGNIYLLLNTKYNWPPCEPQSIQNILEMKCVCHENNSSTRCFRHTIYSAPHLCCSIVMANY